MEKYFFFKRYIISIEEIKRLDTQGD